MYNNKQVEQFLDNLGLSYEWRTPMHGAASIIVENTIEYKPFSHWVTDLRTKKNYHLDNIFKKLCQELAQKK